MNSTATCDVHVTMSNTKRVVNEEGCSILALRTFIPFFPLKDQK